MKLYALKGPDGVIDPFSLAKESSQALFRGLNGDLNIASWKRPIDEGIRAFVARHGYTVVPVEVREVEE